MELLAGIFIFILGTSIGSFLSVVLHRLRTKEKGIFMGRSRCPACKKKLQGKDLVPIFSYLFLKGRCRHCHKEISYHYLLLELITGVVFVLIYAKFSFLSSSSADLTINLAMNLADISRFLFYAIVAAFLIAVFFYDLQFKGIPDIFLFPLIAITFIGSLIFKHPDLKNMILAVLIALIFFGGQRLLSKGKWLGEGDVYLSISMALLLGWQQLLLAIALTYIVGAIISLILLASQKIRTQSKIPFAPFMVIGIFGTIFFGEQILDWYLKFLNL